MAAGADADDFAVFHIDAIDKGAFTDFAAVVFELSNHLLDQGVGAALKGEDTLAHKVGKDDPVSDGRVIDVGTVGVRDRLHKEAVHIAAAGKKLLEHFTCGLGVVVIEVHRTQMVVKAFDMRAVHLEVID